MLPFVSSVLLVIGSIVGGGIVALPIVTAGLSFASTVTVVLFCWFFMTMTGAMILTLSLRCPLRENTYYSIVGRHLGLHFQTLCTFSFLMLLYFSLSSYSSGLASLAMSWVALSAKNPFIYALMSFAIVAVAAVFISSKRQWVLNGNIFFVCLKLTLLALVIVICIPYANDQQWREGAAVNQAFSPVFLVVLNAFGFHFIVPSIVTSFGRRTWWYYFAVLLTGTSVVAALYLCWLWSIQAIVPVHGEWGLLAIQSSDNQLLALNESIQHHAQSAATGAVLRFFQTVSMLGSFICVGLGLLDFIRDSMKTNVCLRVILVTFVPPFLLSLMSQNMYLKAMLLCGYLAVFLEIIVPVMAYASCRFKRSD